MRSAQYRLINNEELYDIGNDPSETNNLFAQKPEVARAMMDAYDTWWQEVRPFMVNEGVRMTGLDSYRKTCEKQLAEGPLPAWQTPTLP